jgi:hypothetical protein
MSGKVLKARDGFAVDEERIQRFRREIVYRQPQLVALRVRLIREEKALLLVSYRKVLPDQWLRRQGG